MSEPSQDAARLVIDAPATVDATARDAARERQALLTKPAGALGRLEELSVWLAGVQGACPPRPFGHPVLVIFAGDHGVARTAGTSAYPPEVTAQMVANFVTGGAAANVLARRTGATVRVVDVSVDADPDYVSALDPTVSRRRIRRGSGSIDREDAMSVDELWAAVQLGKDLADSAVADGADVLIAGDMGIGNTAPAAALISRLTSLPPDEITGRGTGIDDATLQRKRATVAKAVARTTDTDDPWEIVRRAGGPDVAAMVGFLLQAGARGVPLVLDGIVSCSAALVARGVHPQVAEWWVAGHRSTEPAASAALASLGLAPVLDLDLRLGEGTGALLALPILNAAAATLAEMATFESAGVSDRDAHA